MLLLRMLYCWEPKLGEYGPGDHGAYQRFYAGKCSVVKWPVFNWKPYWNLPNVAKIIHFHGPKPNDYHRFLHDNTTGNAMFDHLLKKSSCHSPSSHCRQAIDLFDHFMLRANVERGQVNTRPLDDDDMAQEDDYSQGRTMTREGKILVPLAESVLVVVPLSEAQAVYALIGVVGMLWTILLLSGRRVPPQVASTSAKHLQDDNCRVHAA